MEFLVVILIILSIVLLLNLSRLSTDFNKFRRKYDKDTKILSDNLKSTYTKLEILERSLQQSNIETKLENLQPEKPKTDEKITEKPIVAEKTVKPEEKPIIEKSEFEELLKPKLEIKTPPPIKKPVTQQAKITAKKPQAKKNIAPRKKIDYEKLIGENFLNKIGIAILVIGIGFFVKYAIDKNWIGEYGRVAIGIGVGALLIGIAHFIRKNYKAFSSVLIGGGIGAFYYTISIAYHEYEIFSQSTAFFIMIFITAIAVVLSVIYDKKEIAIIGLIGGFTSPFMVKGETENYIAFFTYIAILNSGLLALSYFKKWSIITKLAYGFTVLYLGTWLISQLLTDSETFPTQFGLTISTIYYFQFLGMSLWYNIKHKIKFKAPEFIQILSINALYFFAGVSILNDFQSGDFQGLFALSLALFNFLVYLILTKSKSTDKSLGLVFIGKSITFITLAILLHFDTQFATLFWALEAVALLWIGTRTKQDLLKQAFALVTVIVSFGLFYSWSEQFYDFDNSMVFDTRFLIHLGTIFSYLISIFLLLKAKKEVTILEIPIKIYIGAIGFWAYLAFFISVFIKLIIHLENYPVTYFSDLILWIYTLLMISIGTTFVRIKKLELFREFFAILSVLTIFVYLFSGNYTIINFRNFVLQNSFSNAYFFVHFIAVSLVIYLLYSVQKIALQIIKDVKIENMVFALMSILGLVLASMELDHISIFLFFKQGTDLQAILEQTQRAGYTTLWGIYSFALIFYGMKQKNQYARLLSLALFAVTLLKLFVLDIRAMSDGGKIIAFVSLGILLLIVSFLYQKLRKIIVGE